MSLNALLDFDDDETQSVDESGRMEHIITMGVGDNCAVVTDRISIVLPTPDETSTALSSEIKNGEDLSKFLDDAVGMQDEPTDMEWEDECDVNMVLRATSRVQTPRAAPVSAHSIPGSDSMMSPASTPNVANGLGAPLQMPLTDINSHCQFKDELIGSEKPQDQGEESNVGDYEDLMPGLYFVGIHRVEVGKDQRACFLVVRPDVCADAILDLVEQVLMSFGGAVAHYTQHDVTPLPQTVPTAPEPTNTASSDAGGRGDGVTAPYPQQVREIRGVQNSDCWDSISVFLGTDVFKRRVLCVLATPFSAASLGSTVVGMLGGYNWFSNSRGGDTANPEESKAPNSGMVKRTAADMAAASESSGTDVFQSTVISLVGALLSALEDEKLTATYIGLRSSVENIDSMHARQLSGLRSADTQALEYHPPVGLVHAAAGDRGATGKGLESLVDPLFVRDLMGSYAQELRYNLEAVGVSLDSFVAKLEKQCARLMTTLKPMYQRCNVVLPPPPDKKPLSAFKLVMPDSQSFLVSTVVAEEANGVGVNLARLLILRARRAFMNNQKERAGDVAASATPEVDGGELSELRYVLTHIFRQLRRYSETEARARVLRKTDAVTARITDIENYRLRLLHVLHKRFESTVSVVSRDDHFSSASMVMPSSLSQKEKDSMALFISRFRIAAYEEPPLLDYPACFCGMVTTESLHEPNNKPLLVSRWGHMYITHKDIFFHADAAAMSNVMGLFSKSTAADIIQLVLPISTISQCHSGPKISAPISTALGKKKDTAMELQDSVGNVYVFGMPVGSPPQYASRVTDLLTILQSCVLSGHDLNNMIDSAPEEKTNSEKNSASRTEIAEKSASNMAVKAITVKSTENISGENGGILSSRREAFTHVMNLASSALDSALPRKLRSQNSAVNSNTSTNNMSGGEEVPPKNVVVKGDTDGWFQSASIGSSVSVTSGGSAVSANRASQHSVVPPTTLTADPGLVNVATTSANVSGLEATEKPKRPKAASLGKNIQMFLKEQQQQTKQPKSPT